jgi:ABC-2 type transport system permease protein/oleandomycin transport system permease protein
MTTTTLSPYVAVDPPALPVAQRFRLGLADVITLTRREVMVWLRNPAYIFFTVIQPVIFVLLFRYVFGGAIPVHVPGGYVNFLMPGIIAQSAAFASFSRPCSWGD